MNMVKVLVKELEGPALRWAVADVLGLQPQIKAPVYGLPHQIVVTDGMRLIAWRPDAEPEQGLKLITDHAKSFGIVQNTDQWRVFAKRQHDYDQLMALAGGDSLLLATCRAVLAVNRGSDFDDGGNILIEVPAELVQP